MTSTMVAVNASWVGPITLIGKSLGYSMRDSLGGIAAIIIPIVDELMKRRQCASRYCSQWMWGPFRQKKASPEAGRKTIRDNGIVGTMVPSREPPGLRTVLRSCLARVPVRWTVRTIAAPGHRLVTGCAIGGANRRNRAVDGRRRPSTLPRVFLAGIALVAARSPLRRPGLRLRWLGLRLWRCLRRRRRRRWWRGRRRDHGPWRRRGGRGDSHRGRGTLHLLAPVVQDLAAPFDLGVHDLAAALGLLLGRAARWGELRLVWLRLRLGHHGIARGGIAGRLARHGRNDMALGPVRNAVAVAVGAGIGHALGVVGNAVVVDVALQAVVDAVAVTVAALGRVDDAVAITVAFRPRLARARLHPVRDTVAIQVGRLGAVGDAVAVTVRALHAIGHAVPVAVALQAVDDAVAVDIPVKGALAYGNAGRRHAHAVGQHGNRVREHGGTGRLADGHGAALLEAVVRDHGQAVAAAIAAIDELLAGAVRQAQAVAVLGRHAVGRLIAVARRQRIPAQPGASVAVAEIDIPLRAADPAHQRRRPHVAARGAAGGPAPATVDQHPAAVMAGRIAPGRVVDPRPAPWRQPGPAAVTVGRPVGRHRTRRP